MNTKEAAREEAIKAAATAYSYDDYLAGALGQCYDAGYESAREKWTAFNWDDASKQPSESGWYLCRDPYPGESQPVVCDEWNGSEFVHYGVYGAWMPIPPYQQGGE